MLAMMLLLLQGSDSGVIVACTVMGVCFWLDRKQTGHWEVYFLFLAAVALGMCRWGKWMLYLGTFDILLQDGIAKNWQPGRDGFRLQQGVCCFGEPVAGFRRIRKNIARGSIVLCTGRNSGSAGMVSASVVGNRFCGMGQSPGKIVADGMDGFPERKSASEAVGSRPGLFCIVSGRTVAGRHDAFDKGYFEGSVFTNAHNEWLTTLVNMGLLGVAAYAAVFITALQTYRKNFLAVLLLLTYGIHSLISFQQVLNAPLFFLILGLCEAAARGEKTKTNQMDTDEELLEAI